MTAMLLLIHYILEAIQYVRNILNIIIIAQYILHDEETLCYIKYILYRLEKTKILLEQHQFLNFKLCWLAFNYPKFYLINHFV